MGVKRRVCGRKRGHGLDRPMEDSIGFGIDVRRRKHSLLFLLLPRQYYRVMLTADGLWELLGPQQAKAKKESGGNAAVVVPGAYRSLLVRRIAVRPCEMGECMGAALFPNVSTLCLLLIPPASMH